MRDRDRRTAEKFNIIEKCEKLENELLQIEGVTEVDFDLDGFYDNMYQVIILTKYSIPVASDTLNKYYEVRRQLLKNVVEVAANNELTRTEDSIEDYGEHFYFVFYCSKNWEA